MVAQTQADAVNRARHAAPGQRLKVQHLAGSACQTGGNGLGHRVVRPHGEAGRQMLSLGLVTIAPHAPVDQPGLAFGEGAGFVERHGFEPPGVFKVGAALDQNAAPGRCRQPADHGHRG